jgi:hypothetical protein
MLHLTDNKIFYYLATLSFKSALAFGTAVSGVIGVILGELFTNQWGSATLSGAIAASVGGFFIFIPRFMEQRRKNVQTFSEIKDKEMTTHLARLAELHKEELTFHKLKEAEAIYVASLERKAKHDLFSELTGAQSHNQILVNQLLELGQKPLVTLHPIDYKKITGAVDEEIQVLRRQSVDLAQMAVVAADGPSKVATG